jgi:hypothetical protein
MVSEPPVVHRSMARKFHHSLQLGTKRCKTTSLNLNPCVHLSGEHSRRNALYAADDSSLATTIPF